MLQFAERLSPHSGSEINFHVISIWVQGLMRNILIVPYNNVDDYDVWVRKGRLSLHLDLHPSASDSGR